MKVPGALVAWPNPAVGSVALRFAIPSDENPSLGIYDVSGRHIRTLVTNSRSSAEQELLWDGNDDQGRSVASGTYFVRLQWAEGSATSRVMLLR
ncbi:MAG TPA: T9SS type A sorting domain-containing protein [bacterium]|nr:T9SS type A sorting domain-containing protein [bacterium]